jgi:hypothetical protein
MGLCASRNDVRATNRNDRTEVNLSKRFQQSSVNIQKTPPLEEKSAYLFADSEQMNNERMMTCHLISIHSILRIAKLILDYSLLAPCPRRNTRSRITYEFQQSEWLSPSRIKAKGRMTFPQLKGCG